jgi:hypothetical protein
VLNAVASAHIPHGVSEREVLPSSDDVLESAVAQDPTQTELERVQALMARGLDVATGSSPFVGCFEDILVVVQGPVDHLDAAGLHAASFTPHPAPEEALLATIPAEEGES